MKQFRGTLLFAMIVIAVAGLAVWQMQKQKQEEAEKPNADLLLAGVRTSDITELDFQGATRKFKLKSENAHWQVVEPLKDKADDQDVESFLQKLVDLHATAIDAGDSTIQWSKYGLADADPTITVKVKTGAATTLRVGRIKTYDNGYYLRKNDENKLLTATAAVDGIVNENLNSLRLKKLDLPSSVPLKAAIRSTIKDKTFNFELASNKDVWAFNSDKNVKIAGKNIVVWLEDFKALKADNIVSDSKDPQDLKKFGFVPALVTFNFEFQNPEGPDKVNVPIEIKFSQYKDNDVYYTWSGSSSIYAIRKTRLDSLVKTLDSLRDHKEPFEFETASVAKVKFTSPDIKSGLTLVKTGTLWAQNPVNAKKKVNDSVVLDFASNVHALEASDFLKVGSKTASREYQAEFFDDKGVSLLRIEFGGLYKDAKNNQEFYVVKSSKCKDLLAVRKASVDKLVKPNLIQDIEQPSKVSETKKVEQTPRDQVSAAKMPGAPATKAPTTSDKKND